MTEKLKILFLAANPATTGRRLRLDQEIREVSQKIRTSPHRHSVEIISEWAVRPGDLQAALLQHCPHIVHFSGRGNDTQGIYLEDNLGNPKLVSKQALDQLFKILKDNIIAVVLNACYVGDQAASLSEIIDCTIGMSGKMEDEAAIVFAAYFYQSLAFGRSLKDAFYLAVNQLELEGIGSGTTPELFVRPGVDISKTFVFRNRAASFSITHNSSKTYAAPDGRQSAPSLKVFLCHSSNDKAAVRKLCEQLRSDGIAPWLDEEQLLPGQNWQLEIAKAVRSSDAVLICLSESALNKTGYIQKELKFALDVADEQPDGAIFLIPLKLQECDIPERMRRWQWVNLFEENGYSRLLLALKARAAALGLSV